MTKSVASLVDDQQQALACNRRYLEALAVVDDPTPAYNDCGNSPSPKRSRVGVMPVSIPHGAKTCGCS